MPKPKLSAKDRKRKRLEKQTRVHLERKRRATGEAMGERFMAAVDRWRARDADEGPLMESCPGCGAPIVVRYEGGNIHPGHAMPVCEGFGLLQVVLNAPVHLESWSNADMARMSLGVEPEGGVTRHEIS